MMHKKRSHYEAIDPTEVCHLVAVVGLMHR